MREKREEGKDNEKTCHLFDVVFACYSLGFKAGKESKKKRPI